MKLTTIEYGTSQYDEMVALRNKILREPLGIAFTEAEKLRDKVDTLCCCLVGEQIVGCCLLSKVDDNTLQLRQMAVLKELQKKNIGANVLTFAEEKARELGYNTIMLHAREEAAGFYGKFGYLTQGDKFLEVGIPHYEMIKRI